MDKKISNIVFTKNRPLQLEGYLESLYGHFSADLIQTYIIYKPELFGEQYDRLFGKYSDCVVVRETDFSTDFFSILNEINTEYMLFGVDDVVYFDSVDFKVIDETFKKFSEDIFGFSLRFSEQNINKSDPVYGPIENLPELVKTKGVDEVYLALGASQAHQIYPILESLQYAGTTIRIIPDWGNLMSISKPVVVPIGSQLLFSAAESPLSGKNLIFKQAFDFVVAMLLLIIFSIPMLAIALLVKLTSKGPVFYKQTRTGLDQRDFEILKFRTMKVGAEKENGPQWSTQDDTRCTPIGKLLRKTSIDELPQLINVAMGQMSLVGPRPERPYFVKQFSEEYKKYMLRHKVKSGITGWAQIHGFRGDTSLRKRLIYDLYYVRNWSFGLDLWVLLLTPWHIIKGENAH